MHWWNTAALAVKIKDGQLSGLDKKNYYLGTSIVVLITTYLGLISPPSNKQALAAEAITVLLVVVAGINATFTANGRGAGTDYIARMTILAFPLSIKLFAVSLSI